MVSMVSLVKCLCICINTTPSLIPAKRASIEIESVSGKLRVLMVTRVLPGVQETKL